MVRPCGHITLQFPVLPRDSTPEPLLNPDDAPERRRLLCRRYNECLSHAAASGWQSFGCGSCPVRDDMSAEEQQSDLEGLADFLRALSANERT